MKRCEPGDMERSVPRVYVPLSLPDAAVPTYAVLEFVGFSRPVLQQPPGASAMLCLPHPVPAAASSVISSHPNPSSHSFVPLTAVEHPLAVSNRPASFHSAHPLSLHSNFHRVESTSRPQAPPPQGLHLVWPNAAPEIVNLDSPPSSPSSAVSKVGSTSNVSRDSSEKSFPTMACRMPNISAAGTATGAPPGKNTLGISESGGTAPRISVSQTERETIVHTHHSNFRDVVRQLTGASSDDKDLLPVTLPARLTNRANEGGSKYDSNAKSEASVAPTRSAAELGLRKAPLKLHERRKAMRSLEKLSTSYADVPPLVPSPVTPLASDFEKFCSATTPTGSQRSVVISPGRVVVEDCASVEQRAQSDAALQGTDANYFVQQQQQQHQRPQKKGPTLLNLFPESPVCSPRE